MSVGKEKKKKCVREQRKVSGFFLTCETYTRDDKFGGFSLG